MPILTRVVLVLATIGLAALIASPVSAHAFGQRYDLPIPLNYFLIGAVAVVALSFVVAWDVRAEERRQIEYPRLNLLRVPVGGASAVEPDRVRGCQSCSPLRSSYC